MKRYPKRYWILAACLAALAGYVDAIGFLRLGGFFVSFMSGNSTRLAVGVAEGSEAALLAGGLVASFLGGVVAGSVVAASSGAFRKSAVLLLAAVLLAFAALLDARTGGGAPFAMAAAMGAANCVFQRDGEVSVGVTYMTGTLVKLGQHLAGVLLGRDRFGWLPYLLLWSGLVAGAVAGAALYPRLGTAGLWIASGAAALLAALAGLLDRAAPDEAGPAGGDPRGRLRDSG